jgi:hypothetical protein
LGLVHGCSSGLALGISAWPYPDDERHIAESTVLTEYFESAAATSLPLRTRPRMPDVWRTITRNSVLAPGSAYVSPLVSASRRSR